MSHDRPTDKSWIECLLVKVIFTRKFGFYHFDSSQLRYLTTPYNPNSRGLSASDGYIFSNTHFNLTTHFVVLGGCVRGRPISSRGEPKGVVTFTPLQTSDVMHICLIVSVCVFRKKLCLSHCCETYGVYCPWLLEQNIFF